MMEERISKVEGIVEQMSERLNHIESRLASVERFMVGLQERVTSLQERVARVEAILEQMNERLTHLESWLGRMDTRFNWLTGIIITMWVTIIAAILFK